MTNSSVRFIYNDQTITAQYYVGAAPDPQREKYVFTILNGRIVNSRTTYPRDSNVVTQSYYTNKKLFTWHAVGFNFFGTATSGLPYQGQGISLPVQMLPFLIYYPSVNALNETTKDLYEWSTAQNKWVFKNTSTYARPETVYQYDEAGYLIAFPGAQKIEWE